MPNRDTTGPMGTGMRTGKQMGQCAQNTTNGENSTNLRMGRGRGMGRGICRRVEFSNMNDQEFLKQEKLILEQRLSIINSQLNQEQ